MMISNILWPDVFFFRGPMRIARNYQRKIQGEE